MNEVSFSITKTEELEYGANYQVTVDFPFNTGWIDYLDLVVVKDSDTITIPIKHKTNENDKIMKLYNIVEITSGTFKHGNATLIKRLIKGIHEVDLDGVGFKGKSGEF